MLRLNVEKLCQEITTCGVFRTAGKLRSVSGLLTCSLPAAVGDQCEIVLDRQRKIRADVVGVTDGLARLAPYESVEGLRCGMAVTCSPRRLRVPVGEELLGRVLDGLGRPVDGGRPLERCPGRTVRLSPPAPLERRVIRQPFCTGQRAIDALLTSGRGQRVGIFAGSGVGKSTLLGEIAKGCSSDLNVIALIGERGRELRPFLEDCLGVQGLARSVVVVATCEQPPLMRVRAAQTAVTIADYFRERGSDVVFMLDSLTRMAMAQRELGLALGEPPSTRGYTPSVFQLLATTLECLGNSSTGSITGIVTVLVDGDDLDEPISDSVRALVDGHIVLDRRMAERGHFPAVNIHQSISRVFRDVTDPAHQVSARKLREILATFAEAEDLLRIGAYAKGSSPQVDRAIELLPALHAFLRQDIGDQTPFDQTRAVMDQIAATWLF